MDCIVSHLFKKRYNQACHLLVMIAQAESSDFINCYFAKKCSGRITSTHLWEWAHFKRWCPPNWRLLQNKNYCFCQITLAQVTTTAMRIYICMICFWVFLNPAYTQRSAGSIREAIIGGWGGQVSAATRRPPGTVQGTGDQAESLSARRTQAFTSCERTHLRVRLNEPANLIVRSL